jgi:hypothetical protein
MLKKQKLNLSYFQLPSFNNINELYCQFNDEKKHLYFIFFICLP